MNIMNRRRFLAITAATCTSLKGLAQEVPYSAVLTLHPKMPLCTVPGDFAGLSYELLGLVDSGSFTADNRELIKQFRFISPGGVLRLGGNTSDFSYWKPAPDSPVPPRRPAHAFGTPPVEDKPFPVTLENLENLRGFLDATGWTCIYGINLATNVPPVAVEEAAAVTKILGNKLQFLQIGNEADRYAINKRRDLSTWGPEAYFKEWLSFARPIAAHIPSVRLGLPDMAAKPDWFAAVVDGLRNDPLGSRIAMLTYHYYQDGPASNPKMNITNLLNSNVEVIEDVEVVRGAAESLHAPWRMTEGNTCYSGGKQGVSDVFASALWAADYMLLHASLGCGGINLHGGGAGNYTPIAHIGESYIARPLVYGMRFASQFAGLRMISIDWDPGPVNATAYAAVAPGGKKVIAVINKDSTRPVKFGLRGYKAELSLSAPSLESRSTVIGKPPAEQQTGLVPAGSATLFREL